MEACPADLAIKSICFVKCFADMKNYPLHHFARIYLFLAKLKYIFKGDLGAKLYTETVDILRYAQDILIPVAPHSRSFLSV